MSFDTADVVFVKGLKVEAVIGVYEWERAITQPILIDIALETDISKAIVSDEVATALNYKAEYDDVSVRFKELQAQLQVNVVAQLAEKLLETYSCPSLTFSNA